MTKTPLNRITTSIMNLWVNRIGQLLIIAVALFFLSCHEENSVLGYKNPNSKFKARYVELTIPSSVLLRDSLRTSNYYFSDEANRFLVGKYSDDKFGVITSNAVTQYFTTTATKVGSTAVFDSVTLQLQFDLYHYGSNAVTPQTISIYEIDRELKIDSLVQYYNRSRVPYSRQVGTKTFTIHPDDFDKFATSSTDYDTVITIKMPLDPAFGQKIFNSALVYRDAASTADSLFIKYTEFVKQFKGLMIKAEDGDKVVGFDPSSNSRMILHYHETDKDSLSLSLGFSPWASFNEISADRAGTPLMDLNQYYQDYLQESDSRYVQAGTGILTKLDFSPFYAFRDTAENILINSAELVIGDLETGGYTPPQYLALRVLNTNTNRFKKLSSAQDTSDYAAYRGYILYDGNPSAAVVVEPDLAFYAHGDQSSQLAYSSTTNSYSLVMSLFFQQLTRQDVERTTYQNFVLHPGSQITGTPARQSPSKSLNRVVFPKDKIKLRIYYTKPLLNQ